MHVTPDSRQRVQALTGEELYFLMPLRFFYERKGLPLPEFVFLPGELMPGPERSLLVHDEDMTPRLSRHHESDLGLRVLQQEVSDDYLLRMVVLETVPGRRTVEYGAIGIHLGVLPRRVRDLIVEGKRPLGGILASEKVTHQGRPRAFFRVDADDVISEALDAPKGTALFGRCNQLTDSEGMALADVVEILPENGGPGRAPQT